MIHQERTIVLKRLALFALCLTMLFGCTPQEQPAEPSEEEPVQEVSAPEILYREPTVEEAAAGNSAISEKGITLIQFEEPQKGDPIARFQTLAGEIVVRLFPRQAPLAVENFAMLAQDGYYDGMGFYKVMEDFLIQSGAPANKPPTSIYTDEEGEPISFATETSLDLWNFRGALVMKSRGPEQPDSNTSEFFIVQSDRISEALAEQMEEIGYPGKVLEKYREVGGIPGFDGRYTVFGQVISGMEVVDDIASAPVGKVYNPLEPAIIESILMEPYDPANPPVVLGQSDEEETQSDEEDSGGEVA